MKAMVTRQYLENQLRRTKELYAILLRENLTGPTLGKVRDYLHRKKHVLEYHVREGDHEVDFDLLG